MSVPISDQAAPVYENRPSEQKAKVHLTSEPITSNLNSLLVAIVPIKSWYNSTPTTILSPKDLYKFAQET
jgi:hypothetical protein